MIELSIPQLNEEQQSVKDIVFLIVTQEQPLSIIEIHRRAKRHYNLRITYQAVRKSVERLHEQGVLDKQQLRYRISKRWVLHLKSFVDNLLMQIERGKQAHEFSAEVAKDDYAVYTFSNLLDLDNFWGDVMRHWAMHLEPDDDRHYFAQVHYGWWHLINLGRETSLFDAFRKQKVRSHIEYQIDAPLNRWSASIYKASGVGTNIKSGKHTASIVDVNILGDMIIQVRYPSALVRKLQTFYRKYRTMQEMNHTEVTKIAHEQAEIKFIMFKNPTMAASLRQGFSARTRNA